MLMLEARQMKPIEALLSGAGFSLQLRQLITHHSTQEYFLEGAFRNVHTRLRTHAESIAFFGGGVREGKSIAVIFDTLISHLRAVVDIR